MLLDKSIINQLGLWNIFRWFWKIKKGSSEFVIVCDFFLGILEVPLCLYKTLVTQTDMKMRAFTVPLFHNFELQVLTSYSYKNHESYSLMRLKISSSLLPSFESWETNPSENFETKVFTWTSLDVEFTSKRWLNVRGNSSIHLNNNIFKRITW